MQLHLMNFHKCCQNLNSSYLSIFFNKRVEIALVTLHYSFKYFFLFPYILFLILSISPFLLLYLWVKPPSFQRYNLIYLESTLGLQNGYLDSSLLNVFSQVSTCHYSVCEVRHAIPSMKLLHILVLKCDILFKVCTSSCIRQYHKHVSIFSLRLTYIW